MTEAIMCQIGIRTAMLSISGSLIINFIFVSDFIIKIFTYTKISCFCTSTVANLSFNPNLIIGFLFCRLTDSISFSQPNAFVSNDELTNQYPERTLDALVSTPIVLPSDTKLLKVEFNAADLSSGVYFYRMQAGDYVKTRKMTLLKQNFGERDLPSESLNDFHPGSALDLYRLLFLFVIRQTLLFCQRIRAYISQ